MKRRKLRFPKHVTVLGCRGTGFSDSDAKADAHRKIETAMSADYSPTIITCRNTMGVLWCDKGEYIYALFPLNDTVKVTKEKCQIDCGTDRKAALDSMAAHICQNEWTPADGKVIPDAMALCSERAKSGFLSWCQFQLAYRHAVTEYGMNDCEAHRWAGFHSSEF